MNILRGLANLRVVVRALPSQSSRHILREVWRIERALPHWFAAQPLPELMKRLDAEAASQNIHADAKTITGLTDAAVGLDYFSPLGICLRRSLVRYVLLRRARVPVVVHFGAKKVEMPHRVVSTIAGHAWLTLDGLPFAEKPEDYDGFTPIYSYPENLKPQTSNLKSRIPNSNFQSPISNL